MSKEIIIDDVDVSGCEDLSRFKDGYCCGKQYEEFASCEGYDCAYKQLKRLQAENEELKKENKEINERMSDVIYRATGGRLSYSNYTLDAIEHAFQDQLEILSDRKAEELEQEIEELKEDKKQYELYIKHERDNNFNYKQALEEIREIAKIAFIVCDDECGNANKFAEIQDKINEVLK